MATTLDPVRGVAQAMLRHYAPPSAPASARRWGTPGQLARALDPRTVQTPALDLIDAELVRLMDEPDGRLILSMPPQEGKSSRVAEMFPVWALHQNPDLRIVVASYGMALARRNGRAIRNRILSNEQALDLRIRDDLAAQHEWQLADHAGGVYAAGIGSALTGRPADCVSADTHIITDRGDITAAAAFRLGITRILAYDHAAGRTVWRKVEASRRIRGRRVVEIVTQSGRTLTCTSDHRVYTSRGYLPAGRLRPGDALVALVATGGMPVREPARRSEDGRPQSCSPRSEPVLRTHLHGGSAQRDQQDPVLRMRRASPQDASFDLLQRLREEAQEASDEALSAVRRAVSAPDVTQHVLHEGMRRRRTFAPDDREGELALQGRAELCALVPVHAAANLGARRSRVRGVQDGPGAGVHAAWPQGRSVSVGDTSHRRGCEQQPAGESAHSLREVPLRAPQVEPDTVAMVRDRGAEAVDVYDFQVADTRNFFGNGVLVHNCLIIDDPIKDRGEADSATYRQNVWDWWTDVASTRLAPGAPVVLILTRWHQDDLAGRLLAAEDGHLWRVINIAAQADHRPEDGETDPLGRAPGEYMASARGRTEAQWEAIKTRSGSRTWNALYQGRPSPAEGGIFHRNWWGEYDQPRWVEQPDGTRWAIGADEVAQSWDMAFKDTSASDYVVGQVWGRWGTDVYLLDQIHERLSFVDTLHAVRTLTARWPQAVAKFIEDKANGTAVINSLSRTVAGLIPVEPDGSKEARASAVSPFVEAGAVHLPSPELAPWVGSFVDEHAAFPTGSHDDQVDATTQALNRLLLNPILAGNLVIDADDLDDELRVDISPY